ncbi:DUF3800 domain-containing protein [Streptococcus pacificus]|uniref:DUF3800 domain-containing protein n=1 Tax=Streptococcus pacificus TaxID=2740577 RepID=A0ABS0ZKN0_9STRE|nr:DUF3800 domain-containing protein [Streptococcus pacificus]MBJ8326489.1 DUF3800 domain-containing protein [Streptococcus pacificus]
MKLYVDEAGTITNSRSPKNRFFVICMVECIKHHKVIREYRQAKKDYLENHPDCKFDIKDEIKGSEMPYGMKKLIFERLRDRTDITFHFKIIDNYELTPNLKEYPSISFNYFVGLTVKKIFRNTNDQHSNLYMLIDERNQSVESLNSLEEYLKIELCIKNNYTKKVTIKYKDSKTKDLIQISDIFVNTVYRICKNHYVKNTDQKNRTLLSICNIGSRDYFPKHANQLDIC